MTTSTVIDASQILSEISAQGLDPRQSGGGDEHKFHCPNRCGKPKHKAYYNVQKGTWYCQRCKDGGGYNSLLDALGVARNRRRMRFTQSTFEPQKATISMEKVAGHFANSTRRRVYEAKLRSYLSGRGWDEHIQDLALSTVGLCWVEEPFNDGRGEHYKNNDLEQFAQACCSVHRQVVTLLFDEEGNPHSAMRRPISATSDGLPKAMRISNTLAGSSPKGGVFFGIIPKAVQRNVILLVEGDADYVAGSALCAHLKTLDVDAACIGVVGLTHRKAAHAILRQCGDPVPTVLICPDIDRSNRGLTSAQEGLRVLAQRLPVAVLDLGSFANEEGEIDLSDAVAEYGLKTIGKLAQAALGSSNNTTQEAKQSSEDHAQDDEEDEVIEALHAVLNDSHEVALFIEEQQGDESIPIAKIQSVYLRRVTLACEHEASEWMEGDQDIISSQVAEALKVIGISSAKRIANKAAKGAWMKVEAKRRDERRKQLVEKEKVWKNAPVDGHHLPEGYTTDGKRIWRKKIKTGWGGEEEVSLVPVSLQPILIQSLYEDLTDDSQSVRLGWRHHGRWLQSRLIGREELASRRDIISLARHGAPVNSSNAAEVVRYIFDYEDTNSDAIPIERVSSRLGWVLNQTTFLWGAEGHIGKGGVAFRPRSDGDEQIARGFHTAGSFEVWRDTIRQAYPYPRVMMALWAALCTPWLEILGAPNFALDWFYSTSAGKSTLLRVAASVWGRPDEHNPESAMRTWAGTRAAFEDLATVANGLPVVLDDTKRQPDPEIIAGVVYDTIQGAGKGRSTKDGGTRKGQTWRTILLSTGEQAITSFTRDGGLAARCIVIKGQPFNRTWSDRDRDPQHRLSEGEKAEILSESAQAEVVDAINNTLIKHYGHAGPMMLREMVAASEHERVTWGKLWKRRQKEWSERLKGDSVLRRMSKYLALIDTVGELVWHWIFNEPYRSPCLELLEDLRASIVEVDRTKQAANLLVSWAQSRRNDFYNVQNKDAFPPHGNWIGRWDDEGEIVSISSKVANEVLEKAGFEPSSTTGFFADKGWTKTNKGRKDHNVRLKPHPKAPNDISMKCVSLIKSEVGFDPPPPSSPALAP